MKLHGVQKVYYSNKNDNSKKDDYSNKNDDSKKDDDSKQSLNKFEFACENLHDMSNTYVSESTSIPLPPHASIDAKYDAVFDSKRRRLTYIPYSQSTVLSPQTMEKRTEFASEFIDALPGWPIENLQVCYPQNVCKT